MKGAAHNEGNVDAVCDDAVDDETDNDGTCVNVGVSLVVHKSLLVPKIAKKEYWLKTDIFQTTRMVKGKLCHMIIDVRSCENAISFEVINKLQLPVEKHPTLSCGHSLEEGI
ncbi:hypothetical protein AAC387_Pa02g2275 [Persea americana]